LIDQWKKVGLKVKQRVQPSPAFYATLRKKKDFEVSIDFNCQSIVNPLADVSKWLGSAGNNYAGFEDPVLEKMFLKMTKSADPKEQRKIMRKYETRALHETASSAVTLWWYKINPHRSYVKGWKIAPSHYLNQTLDNIWLDK
jgi:peptide/nickel transport system substrate-binding protein